MGTPKKRRTRLTIDQELERKEKFLIEFRRWGLKSRALNEADITLATLKRWLENDTVFKEKFDSINEEIQLYWQDELEESARNRALARSDVLMKFILSHLDPTYRDKIETEHRGRVDIVYHEPGLDTSEL